MVKCKTVMVALVFLLATAAFAGCSSDQPKDPVTDPLTISMHLWPGYAHSYIAQEQGFFAEEGVDVELKIIKEIPDKWERSTSNSGPETPVTSARAAKTASKSSQRKFRMSAAALKSLPSRLESARNAIVRTTRQHTTEVAASREIGRRAKQIAGLTGVGKDSCWPIRSARVRSALEGTQTGSDGEHDCR